MGCRASAIGSGVGSWLFRHRHLAWGDERFGTNQIRDLSCGEQPFLDHKVGDGAAGLRAR